MASPEFFFSLNCLLTLALLLLSIPSSLSQVPYPPVDPQCNTDSADSLTLLLQGDYICARNSFLTALQNYLMVQKMPYETYISSAYYLGATSCYQCIGNPKDFVALLNTGGYVPEDVIESYTNEMQTIYAVVPSTCDNSPDFCKSPGAANAAEVALYRDCTRVYCFFHPGQQCRPFDSDWLPTTNQLATCLTQEELQNQSDDCPSFGCEKARRHKRSLTEMMKRWWKRTSAEEDEDEKKRKKEKKKPGVKESKRQRLSVSERRRMRRRRQQRNRGEATKRQDLCGTTLACFDCDQQLEFANNDMPCYDGATGGVCCTCFQQPYGFTNSEQSM